APEPDRRDGAAASTIPAEAPPRGVRLGDLTWPEAEARLGPDAVVVIPLGAASKEHGPHLRLRNDEILAEYFAARVLAAADVVLAPTIGYHYYPAFTEYPGSITLRFETARDLVVDVCRSLAAYGPRRFYVLNTGISTLRPLRAAAEVLAAEGILLRFTDLVAALGPVEAELREQEGGTHADELETSMILAIDPAAVDMSKAVKDYHPKGEGGLTRDPDGRGTYSPTGTWGDPTLATRAKGERLCAAMVSAVLSDLDELRGATPPAAATGP
ncbi:MAG: creatininase family protein, partial [Nannocystaceae bacterium]